MHVIDDDTRRIGRLLHYAGLLVTVICAVAGYSLLHAPTLEAIAETSMRTEEVLLSGQNTPLIREQHRNASETLHEVTSRIAAVKGRVPGDADAGAFLKQVTQIAASEQLFIEDFQPLAPSIQNGYAAMEITLKGHGSFAGICAFVDRLNKLTRLSKVKDLTVSATDGELDYPMTATLLIYFALQGDDAKRTPEERRG